ncbi:MAG: AAA domain-containing protein, partial [bacterium]
SEAKLIATTLTKTFSSKELPDRTFDVLIIDESSMAPIPYIYWAARKIAQSVIIVGDFLQLPPICVSKNEMAQKWLGKSIYDVCTVFLESGILTLRIKLWFLIKIVIII